MKSPKLLAMFLTLSAFVVIVLACTSAEPSERVQPAQPEAAAPAPAAGAVTQMRPAVAAPAAPAAPAATSIPLDVLPAPAVAGLEQRPARALPTPVPESLARFGGTLKWISQGSVGSLDPHVTSAAVTLTYGYNLYDTLLSWGRGGRASASDAGGLVGRGRR